MAVVNPKAKGLLDKAEKNSKYLQLISIPQGRPMSSKKNKKLRTVAFAKLLSMKTDSL